MLEYKPDNFMRRSIFEARLDEFSCYTLKQYDRACRKVMMKYGATTWSDIPEMQLGKVFQDMRKALVVGELRAYSQNRMG